MDESTYSREGVLLNGECVKLVSQSICTSVGGILEKELVPRLVLIFLGTESISLRVARYQGKFYAGPT